MSEAFINNDEDKDLLSTAYLMACEDAKRRRSRREVEPRLQDVYDRAYDHTARWEEWNAELNVQARGNLFPVFVQDSVRRCTNPSHPAVMLCGVEMACPRCKDSDVMPPVSIPEETVHPWRIWDGKAS